MSSNNRSSVLPSNVAAEFRAREWARRNDAITALKSSLREWSGKASLMQWPNGARSTIGHSSGRAVGVKYVRTVSEHAAWLNRYAETIYSKTEASNDRGIVVGYATSKYDPGGSEDDECEAIHFVTCDADCVGDWHAIEAVLNDLGVAHIFQRSTGHVDGTKVKWHLHLPLATPLPAGDKEEFRQEYAYVLGILSDIAGLAIDLQHPKNRHAGFDPALANRFNQPSYPGHKETKASPPRELHFAEGLALDFKALLQATDYKFVSAAGSAGPKRNTESFENDNSEPDDTTVGVAFIDALKTAGLLGSEIKPGKYACRCPNEAEHDKARPSNRSTTVAWVNGRFNCRRGSCRKVTGHWVRQWLIENLPETTSTLGDAVDEAGVLRLKRMLCKRDPEVIKIRQDEVAALIDDLHREHVDGTVTVGRFTAGAGKTTATLIYHQDNELPLYMAQPTTENVIASAALCETRQKGSSKLHLGVLNKHRAVLNGGVHPCHYFDRAITAQKHGISVPRAFCSKCEYKDTCSALKPVGNGYIQLAPHNLIPNQANIVYDETPTLFDTKHVSSEDLRRALEILDADVLTHNYVRRIKPWVEVLLAACRYAKEQRDLELPGVAQKYAEDPGPYGWSGIDVIRREFVDRVWDGDRMIDGASNAELITGDHLIDVKQLAELTSKGDEPMLKSVLNGGLLDADLNQDEIDATRIFQAVRAATRERICWRDDGFSVHLRTVAAERIAESGGVILDATEPTEQLRVLNPNIKHVKYHVVDNAEVTRSVLYASDTGKKKLLPSDKADWKRIDRLLARVLEMARAAGVQKLLLMTYKAIDAGLAKEHSLLAGWLADGRSVAVAHYGNLKGRNSFIDLQGQETSCLSFDGFVTIGDARTNLDVAREQLPEGSDFQEVYELLSRRELHQAQGRARAPFRTTKAWCLHVGQNAPLGWEEHPVSIVRLQQGRPTKAVECTPEMFEAYVRELGGAAKAADVLCLQRRYVYHLMSGNRSVSAEVYRDCKILTGFLRCFAFFSRYLVGCAHISHSINYRDICAQAGGINSAGFSLVHSPSTHPSEVSEGYLFVCPSFGPRLAADTPRPRNRFRFAQDVGARRTSRVDLRIIQTRSNTPVRSTQTAAPYTARSTYKPGRTRKPAMAVA